MSSSWTETGLDFCFQAVQKVLNEGGIIMLRNLFVTTDNRIPKTATVTSGNFSAPNRLDHALEATIDDLYTNSRSGLRGLLIFLGASAIALYFNEQTLAGSLPAGIMAQLGATPSVILINWVFGASTLSSLISIAGKIYHEREPGKTSIHLSFRVAFYLLYFISGVLSEYFNVVFIAGLVVLGLQHYNVWNYYMRAIEINTGGCDNTNG